MSNWAITNIQITDAFRQFGILDSTTSLLAIKVGQPSDASLTYDSVSSHLRSNVEGGLLPFKDEYIFGLHDMAKIRKVYRITLADAGGKGGRKKGAKAGAATNGVTSAPAIDGSATSSSVLEDRAEVEAVVLGIMAMKGS